MQSFQSQTSTFNDDSFSQASSASSNLIYSSRVGSVPMRINKEERVRYDKGICPVYPNRELITYGFRPFGYTYSLSHFQLYY